MVIKKIIKRLLPGQPEFERGKKLRFWRSAFHDVYNITAPLVLEPEVHPLPVGELKIGASTYILGRRERRRDAREAAVVWFKKGPGFWLFDKSMPIIRGEDPFVTKIHDADGTWIVVGTVVVDWPADQKNEMALAWRTEFRRGRTIAELRAALRKAPFAVGPQNMKDIRLVGLPDGSIGVFTRPQGKIGGLGKIGFTKIRSLDELKPGKLRAAPIIEGLFKEKEWGGANEIHVLDKDHVGVLGHVACMTAGPRGEKIRHYRAMAFVFNHRTRQFSKYKIIASRADFPRGGAKHRTLKDVIFTGGLVRHADGTASLYVGLSDREAGVKTIKDPLI